MIPRFSRLNARPFTTLGAALVLACAVTAAPAAAQLAVQGASACFAPAAGEPNGELEKLEHRAAATPPDAAALTQLAVTYQTLGCRAAFLTTADKAIAAGSAQAGVLRALMAVTRAQSTDSADTAGLAIAGGDTVLESTLTDAALDQYKNGSYLPAATAFLRVAGFAPSFGARTDARMMAGQSLVDGGRADSAAAIYRTALDSVHAVSDLITAHLADGSLSTFARALATAHAVPLLWAPDIRDGRLLMPAPDSTVAGTLRRVQPAQVTRALDAAGSGAADPVVRAMLWTSSTAGLSALRALDDSLILANVRVNRASDRVQAIRDARAGHVADAARYTKLVATVADSFAVTDKQIAAFADSLVQRDSAIARNLVQYRSTLLDKIASVRARAATNLSNIELVANAAAPGSDALRSAQTERATASEYIAIADAAAGAMEEGIKRLPILYQRDSLHHKLEVLKQSLTAARMVYDSAYRSAQDAESRLAAVEDKGLADAVTEQYNAEQLRDALANQVTAAIEGVLRARAAVLQAQLAKASVAGDYGNGEALFIASLSADSTRGDLGTLAAKRAAAIAALTSAVTVHVQSPMRARALLYLGELLVRHADAEYAVAQRANSAADHPDYGPAMARYDELLRDFPNDPSADAGAYTLGTIAFSSLKYDDAIHAFERVMARPQSSYAREANFRHGDAEFELSTKQTGDARRALLQQAVQSYEHVLTINDAPDDLHFLTLYKLGWSYYQQAERQQSDEYRKAVDVFARLVREMDRLAPGEQSRLSLRQEAVDYLAIAITQLGGADEAVRYLAAIPDAGTRLLVLRRVARALRDQGEFNSAVIVFHAVIDQAPTDAAAVETQLELVDLYQNRMVEADRAQDARLQLVAMSAPTSTWARANAAKATDAQKAASAVIREKVLRETGNVALSNAKKPAARANAPALYATAAEVFGHYIEEFPKADSAQRMSALHAESLFGTGDFFAAGNAYARTSAAWPAGDAVLAASARRNAAVAYDSALVAERRSPAVPGEDPPVRVAREHGIQDSLFAASDRFIAQAPDADARGATIAKGRRAAESARWDVMAATFESFTARWAADPFSAEARKLVGDARYRQGRYTDAQREWRAAQTLATQSGRKALADSIVSVRLSAASTAADSLTKAGQYDQAADSILTGIAGDIGDPTRAADALRNAIEVHLLSDSLARVKGDTAASRAARTRAVVSIERLASAYPAYQHTLTYSALRAKLLGDIGRPADAVTALQTLIQTQPTWPGRADAMVRTAVLLDSLGKHAEAAQGYEQFSVAYPADKRAPDAQYNAALIFSEQKDAVGAARSFAAFAARFPRDGRVAEAQRLRLVQLVAAGDSATANGELTKLCVKPSDVMAVQCSDRNGRAAFALAMTQWDRYEALKLVIGGKSALTRAGVDAASAPKLALLRTLTAGFGRAIASGAPEWIAAGSFQAALAQWEYGLFLRDVQLPDGLTDAQKDGAKRGSATQAQAYFDAALKGWTALIAKADADKFDNAWVVKARGAVKGEGVPAREGTP